MGHSPIQEQPAAKCVRGILCGFDNSGDALVDFPDKTDQGPTVAISTVSLTEADLNREVVLLFEDGDWARPIIIGLRQQTIRQKSQQHISIESDGGRLVIKAEHEIMLRCGKASIHLRSDGSVRIRGIDIVSRASATNRIRGGNVQIN